MGLRKTKQQYYVTIPIEEGEEHYCGKLEIEGAENFSPKVLSLLYGVVEGEILDYVSLKESNASVKKLYSTRGFLDMEAIPEVEIKDDRTVDITISIVEGKQYIVDEIEFSGNTRTRDKVLRREMFIEEQQPFNERCWSTPLFASTSWVSSSGSRRNTMKSSKSRMRAVLT